MNKAITDGLVLTPTPFAAGLDVWSSGDGTAGSDTYENAANALFVAADQDFAGALELLKTQNTQKLRYMGQTPILPGCYLQVTARVKAISGNLPSVRIAGYPAYGSGARVNGLPEFTTFTTLQNYGEVVEIKGIIGTGGRGGVDLVWGTEPVYGHFGIDLVGPNGGIIRVDDIQIEDVTSVFIRDMISIVDVVDYGAIGNGNTDNTAAFEAANSAANGRTVFVPEGNFRLANNVTIDTPVKLEGRVSMPDTAVLLLRRNFDLPTYIEAFEDEEVAFKKAFQALLNNVDHESLDLGGRQITVTAPIDMRAATPNRTSYSTRRVIRNGQLVASDTSAWTTQNITSRASYDPDDKRKLSDVTNIANIPVGALVQGSGVGREIYVRSVDVGAGELTLNEGLFDAAGTQEFTFSHFKCMLDFGGFSKLSKFGMTEVDLQCNARCSGIRLAQSGSTFSMDHCFISRPKDRGITSFGTGCQGMLIDNCQFLSAEEPLVVSDRVSIAFNVNGNDPKIRNCRATKFRHFAVLGGDNNTIIGNHFFQGDEVQNGVRTAGIILTSTYCSTTISDNYVDNCFIEWTNERDAEPDFDGGFSFSALSISNNVFLSGDVAPWFSPIVVKPYGRGHFLNGLVVTGNKFRSINGSIDRVERVDTSFSNLDMSRANRVFFDGNTFHGINIRASNPLRMRHSQGTANRSWVIDTNGQLPFQGETRGVDSIVPEGAIKAANGGDRFSFPHVELRRGGQNDRVNLIWQEAVRGAVMVMVRMDR